VHPIEYIEIDFDVLDINDNYFYNDISTSNKTAFDIQLKKKFISQNFIEYNHLLIERRRHKCDDYDELKKIEQLSLLEDPVMSESIEFKDRIMSDKSHNDVNIYDSNKDILFDSSHNLRKLESCRTFNQSENDDMNNANNTIHSMINNKFREIIISKNHLKNILRESSFNYSEEINFEEL